MKRTDRTDRAELRLDILFLGIALVVFFAGVSLVLAVGEQPVPTEMWAAGGAISGALIGLLVPPPRPVAATGVASSTADEATHEAALKAATEAVSQQSTATKGPANEALSQVKYVRGVASRPPARLVGGTPSRAARAAARSAVALLVGKATEAKKGVEEAEQDLAEATGALQAVRPSSTSTERAQQAPEQAADEKSVTEARERVSHAETAVKSAEAKQAVHSAAAKAAEGAQDEAVSKAVEAVTTSTTSPKMATVLFVVVLVALGAGIALAAEVLSPAAEGQKLLRHAADTLIALGSAAGGALVGLYAPNLSRGSQ